MRKVKETLLEFADIINLFCAMAYLSNYILMLNKPKAVRRKSAGNSGKKAVVSDISENMPKRIVRNIGSMKISSGTFTSFISK